MSYFRESLIGQLEPIMATQFFHFLGRYNENAEVRKANPVSFSIFLKFSFLLILNS